MAKKSGTNSPSLSSETQDFVQNVGEFIEYWGFKNVQGRIWALLYIHKEPLSSIELAQKLKVSKALVSLALPELLQFDVIQECARGTGRTVYYAPNPNLASAIRTVLKKRELQLIKKTHISLKKLEKSGKNTLDSKRIEELGRFIGETESILTGLIDSPLFEV